MMISCGKGFHCWMLKYLNSGPGIGQISCDRQDRPQTAFARLSGSGDDPMLWCCGTAYNIRQWRTSREQWGQSAMAHLCPTRQKSNCCFRDYPARGPLGALTNTPNTSGSLGAMITGLGEMLALSINASNMLPGLCLTDTVCRGSEKSYDTSDQQTDIIHSTVPMGMWFHSFSTDHASWIHY